MAHDALASHKGTMAMLLKEKDVAGGSSVAKTMLTIDMSVRCNVSTCHSRSTHECGPTCFALKRNRECN